MYRNLIQAENQDSCLTLVGNELVVVNTNIVLITSQFSYRSLSAMQHSSVQINFPVK